MHVTPGVLIPHNDVPGVIERLRTVDPKSYTPEIVAEHDVLDQVVGELVERYYARQAPPQGQTAEETNLVPLPFLTVPTIAAKAPSAWIWRDGDDLCLGVADSSGRHRADEVLVLSEEEPWYNLARVLLSITGHAVEVPFGLPDAAERFINLFSKSGFVVDGKKVVYEPMGDYGDCLDNARVLMEKRPELSMWFGLAVYEPPGMQRVWQLHVATFDLENQKLYEATGIPGGAYCGIVLREPEGGE